MKAEYKNAIQSRRKICSAYLTLLTETNNKFSVTDIVKLAGINRGTFYLHFENLQAVEKSIIEELANNFKVLEQDFRQAEIDKTPELILNKFNEILLKDLDYYRLIINASENYNLIEKIKVSILTAISNNFKIMQYVMNYDHFKMVVQYIVGGVIDTYIDWFKGNLTCSIEEISSFLSKLIKGGLKGCINYGI